jgi:hypothetical protein
VTWVPPVCAGRYPTVAYDLQLRRRPDAIAEPTAWVQTVELHTGTVPSHIVNGLTCGEWVEFRVRLLISDAAVDEGGGSQGGPDTVHMPMLPRGDAAAYSEPSVAFRVGYADTTAVVPPHDRRTTSPAVPPADFSEAEIE